MDNVPLPATLGTAIAKNEATQQLSRNLKKSLVIQANALDADGI
jgi:hypothetical protein